MKRFALFAGYEYYPAGGWGDFKDSFDTAAEANAAGIEQVRDRAETGFRSLISLLERM